MRTVFLITLLSCAAFGDEVHVPGDHASIAAALAAAHPGDVVVIAAGEYEETFLLSEGVSLQGAGAEQTTIQGTGSEEPVLTIDGASKVSVSGIRIRGVYGDGVSADDTRALVVVKNPRTRMSACAVTRGVGVGILIEGESRAVIENCSVVENGGTGIWIRGEDTSPTLTNNSVERNEGNGIVIAGATRAEVTNNTCGENGEHGIWVHGAKARPKLEANTCQKNAGDGIRYTQRSGGRAYENVCEENGANGIGVFGGNSDPDLQRNRLAKNRRFGLEIGDGSTPRTHENEFTNNRQISHGEIKLLLDDARFGELETIATRLRANRARFPSSEWQIDYFYKHVTSECRGMDNAAEQTYVQKLNDWRKAHPKSVTPRAALGYAYIEFAWRDRGSGYADTVTAKGWSGFKAYLTKADTILMQAESFDSTTPEVQAAMITVSMGLGKDDSTFLSSAVSLVRGLLSGNKGSRDKTTSVTKTIMSRGLAIEPEYYPLYYRRATMLLPRWGGPYGALEDFAAQSATDTKMTAGDGMYARIAADTLHYVRTEAYQYTFDFDWTRIASGFDDILRQFPQSNYRLNDYALMACVYEERKVASELFERIGEDTSAYVWGTEARYLTWKDWAEGTIEYPVGNALCEAVMAKESNTVIQLLESGTDANATNEKGRTALNIAVQDDSYRIARLLLKHGADPNYMGHEKQGAFHHAVSEGTGNYVRLLLEHGADPNATTRQGSSPLLLAIKWRKPLVVSMLMEEDVDPTIANVIGYTPLHYAARDNLTELATKLIEMGADVNARVEEQWTPLHYAAEMGSTDMAELLIRKGADINAVAGRSTPLRLAKSRQKTETAALIERMGGKMRRPK